MHEIKTVIVDLEYSKDDDSLRDYSDEYYGIGRELIRCKDCKYWGEDGYRKGCKYTTCIMMENDYCSMAERKKNDQTD